MSKQNGENLSGFKSQLYDRQKRLILWQQEIIENSHVLVVGVGGLGCEVSKNLVLAGIGKLSLVDCDTVEVSNLSRQLLFRGSDIGLPKAEVAKNYLEKMNPLVKISSYFDKIENLSSKLIQEVDIIIGALDLWEPRLYLNSECINHNKIFIDGGLEGYIGRVQYIGPRKTACLICHNPEAPSETTLIEPCALVGIPRKREHCVWKAVYEYSEKNGKEPEETDYQAITEIHKMSDSFAKEYKYEVFTELEIKMILWNKIPNIITVNAIIAGIQSQQALLSLHLKSTKLNNKNQESRKNLLESNRIGIPSLTFYNGLINRFVTESIDRDDSCPICGIKKERTFQVKINSEKTISQLLKKVKKNHPKIKGDLMAFRYTNVLFGEEKISKLGLHTGDSIIIQSLLDDKEFKIKLVVED
ncbi:MAG: ThiF family adenylyltransferase [Candidatus Ranarchaeia archaeon]